MKYKRNRELEKRMKKMIELYGFKNVEFQEYGYGVEENEDVIIEALYTGIASNGTISIISVEIDKERDECLLWTREDDDEGKSLWYFIDEMKISRLLFVA